MKGNHSVAPFVVIVLLLMMMIFSNPSSSSSSTSSFCDARPLRPETMSNQGGEAMVIGISNSNIINQEAAVFSHLIGLESDDEEEGCGGEGNDDEEECRMKRRMMAEAHLDYIYTQHHKHP